MIRRHPSREAILEFERLRGRPRRSVGDHLARCAACRSRLSALRELREAAAEATDARPGRDLWSSIEVRLDEGEAVILPVPPAAATAGRRLPRAAVVALVALLGFAGLAAAAVVLTPLGRFLGRAEPPIQQVAPTPSAVPARALEVEVPAGGLSVALPDASDDFRLRVGLRDARLLALVPSEDAARLAFRSGPARIEVSGAERGALDVLVPADGPAVRITARGTLLAVVRDGRVRSVGREDSPDLDATVGELLRTSGAGPR